MVSRNTLVLCLCLLSGAHGLMGAISVPQLKQNFDKAYYAFLPEQENIVESTVGRDQPFKDSMAAISKFMKSNFKKLLPVVADLQKAADDFCSLIPKIFETQLVMLTYKQWTTNRETLRNTLNDAVAHIGSAFGGLDKIQTTKSSDKEAKDFLYYMIDQFNKAVSKIQNDFYAARAKAKNMPFDAQEAEKKGAAANQIYANGSISSTQKWISIMNLIGLDESYTDENYNLALKKFGIIPNQPITAGLVYRNKGNVRSTLSTLYNP